MGATGPEHWASLSSGLDGNVRPLQPGSERSLILF
jgi:hypothetical protein